MKKPWAFIRVPYANPTIIGPGFLDQVPTLGSRVSRAGFRFRISEGLGSKVVGRGLRL